MSKGSKGQPEQSNPKSSEHKVYPESHNGVIASVIEGPAISQFPHSSSSSRFLSEHNSQHFAAPQKASGPTVDSACRHGDR